MVKLETEPLLLPLEPGDIPLIIRLNLGVFCIFSALSSAFTKSYFCKISLSGFAFFMKTWSCLSSRLQFLAR